MRKVIDMSSAEAKQYFLKSTSYFSMKLPEYFDFAELLKDTDLKLSNYTDESWKTAKPESFDNINYKFYHNKDGKYAWRMFQLIHPVIYVNLVNQITETNNWATITNRFREFKLNDKIVCCSDLIESASKQKDDGASIQMWWNSIEQESIKLSLEYEWIGITDISDCYGSIYTHSIAWALHGLETAKLKRNDKTLLGNKIDKLVRDMTYGQTNGIPQGSKLMDFIAEIVLGYGDIMLTNAIKKEKIKDYKILRFRDDYRIFTKTKEDLQTILKILSEELTMLNFRVNAQKTIISDDVISNALKRDKIESLNTNISEQKSIQKKLLQIREFSLVYPNSGALKTLMIDFYKKEIEGLKQKKQDNQVVICIVTDIMYNNPSLYECCAAILSKLLYLENRRNKNKIIKSIEQKFEQVPNAAYLSVWLQRITIVDNKRKEYSWDLCKKIYDNSASIWNSSWLAFAVAEEKIIRNDVVEKLTPIISSKQLDVFDEYKWR